MIKKVQKEHVPETESDCKTRSNFRALFYRVSRAFGCDQNVHVALVTRGARRSTRNRPYVTITHSYVLAFFATRFLLLFRSYFCRNCSFTRRYQHDSVLELFLHFGRRTISANYPDTFIVLDATELCTKIRSCLALQSQLSSSYKSHTTLKDLIGISPNGSVYFVSELWSGSISDRELVIKSVMFCLSKKIYHHIHKQCCLSTFFLYFLTSLIRCLLISMVASQASCFVFQKKKKKNSNHRIHKHCSLSIPLFF